MHCLHADLDLQNCQSMADYVDSRFGCTMSMRWLSPATAPRRTCVCMSALLCLFPPLVGAGSMGETLWQTDLLSLLCMAVAPE